MNTASPSGRGPRQHSLDLDSDVPDVAAVRAWTRAVLPEVTCDELEDVLLVVNELVSNAYDHGRSPRRLRLHHSSEPCFVRAEVDDASPELPTPGRSRFGAGRGRGMVLVDRLAKDWDVTPGTSGKTVWAEITCEPP